MGVARTRPAHPESAWLTGVAPHVDIANFSGLEVDIVNIEPSAASMTAIVTAPAHRRAAADSRFRSSLARLIAWRLESQARGIDPADLEALQQAAQDFAAFWRGIWQRAPEIGARCVDLPLSAARPAGAFAAAQLGKAPLRFCLRAIVGALLALGVAHGLGVPLHGQWAVPTAVAVIQMSIGGSLKAAAEYIMGTIGGALYASAVATILPPSTALSFASALALAIGPLAYAAALGPSLRLAPVTAVLVLVISAKLGEAPLVLALDRLLEVGVGLFVAVAVSFLVLPAPAHTLGLKSGAHALEQMARAVPALMAGTARLSPLQNRRLQDEIGAAVNAFAEIAAEARGERIANLAPDPDPAVLARILRRLRHDLVMLGRAGRAAAEPLPARLAPRLNPLLAEAGASARDYLRASADALMARRQGPTSAWVEGAFGAYLAEVASIRRSGQLTAIPVAEREHIFPLEFALQQLQQNLAELAHCVADWARNPGWRGKLCDLTRRSGMCGPARRSQSGEKC
jgi:uncharacterized membrane protein YccC